jgi:hypothetical protein
LLIWYRITPGIVKHLKGSITNLQIWIIQCYNFITRITNRWNEVFMCANKNICISFHIVN